MLGIIYSCTVQAINLKALYNKYDEWLVNTQKSCNIEIIALDHQKETPRGNQPELMRKAMLSMEKLWHNRNEEEPLESKLASVDEIMDHDPTTYYLCITYKVTGTR